MCAFLAGDQGYQHQTVFEDADHVAFLDRWPTLPGKVIVAPRRHVEHVVGDLSEPEYFQLMRVVRLVALGMEDVLRSERTYLLSLGSQQGNAHVHWHVAGLPPGTPYGQQQYHALMTENGVLAAAADETEALAARLRQAVSTRAASGLGPRSVPGRAMQGPVQDGDGEQQGAGSGHDHGDHDDAAVAHLVAEHDAGDGR